jgi:hypothetical protein
MCEKTFILQGNNNNNNFELEDGPCLADAEAVDEGDEEGDEPEHQDHNSDVPVEQIISLCLLIGKDN